MVMETVPKHICMSGATYYVDKWPADCMSLKDMRAFQLLAATNVSPILFGNCYPQV